MGSSRIRARTHVPCIGRRILNHCATRDALNSLFLSKVFQFNWIYNHIICKSYYICFLLSHICASYFSPYLSALACTSGTMFNNDVGGKNLPTNRRGSFVLPWLPSNSLRGREFAMGGLCGQAVLLERPSLTMPYTPVTPASSAS